MSIVEDAHKIHSRDVSIDLNEVKTDGYRSRQSKMSTPQKTCENNVKMRQIRTPYKSKTIKLALSKVNKK